MQKTSELLDKALSMRPAAEWAKLYGIRPSTFSNAKNIGRLSPVLAGNLALDLGEDAITWIATAALETERETPIRSRLARSIDIGNEQRRHEEMKKAAPSIGAALAGIQPVSEWRKR